MNRLATIAVLLAALCLWMLPIHGAAQPKATAANVAEAKRLFKAGARAYRAGKLEFAVQAFDQAYDLAPKPALRFSAAQALRKQYNLDKNAAHLHKAKRYYEQYLGAVSEGRRRVDAAAAVADIDRILADLAPPPPAAGAGGEGGGASDAPPAPAPTAPPEPPKVGRLQIEASVDDAKGSVAGHLEPATLPQYLELPPGTYRVKVEAPGYKTSEQTIAIEAGRLELVAPELAEQPAHVTIEGDEGADIVIDGRLIGRTPMPGAIDLPSGKHSIAIGRSGHDPHVESIDVGRGKDVRVEADLSLTTQRVFAWSFLIGGGVLTTGGIVLAVASASRQRAAQDIQNDARGNERALTTEEANSFNGALSDRDNLNRISAAAFTLGALGAGIGLLLFVWDDPDLYKAGAELEARVTPRGVVLQGRF